MVIIGTVSAATTELHAASAGGDLGFTVRLSEDSKEEMHDVEAVRCLVAYVMAGQTYWV